MSTFFRARAIGSIFEATSNTWKNSFRSNSLSDKMSRPAKLRIGSSCWIPVNTEYDYERTGAAGPAVPFSAFARYRALATHASNHVEVEIARDEIAVGVVQHLAAGVIELGGELEQHVAPL